MTTLAFTICARNYVGLAQVLGRSVARHGPNVDFRIFVVEKDCDPQDERDVEVLSASHALAPFIGADEYNNMAMMYNVTEFCTALKAACFMYAFAAGYDQCIYMDPDILVTADLQNVTRELNDCAILLTPHLCLPSTKEGPRADRGILATGIYNLGFLALRRSSDTFGFLEWWHQRLRGQAFNDHYNALYTDQRWIDFVPSLFPARAVRIWRHLGCNVAPWNYHERQISLSTDGFEVRPRNRQGGETDDPVPLVFLHFSGFDYRGILDGSFNQLNLADAETYNDLLPLYEFYGDAIRAEADAMARHLRQPYDFDRYADGTLILPSHRRLFRVWRERHGDAAAPFATGPGSFHDAIRSRGLLGRPGGADMAADKANVRNVANPGRMMARARSAFLLLFRLLGRTRFFFLIRSLNRLANVEQHYDTFRLDDAVILMAGAKGAHP